MIFSVASRSRTRERMEPGAVPVLPLRVLCTCTSTRRCMKHRAERHHEGDGSQPSMARGRSSWVRFGRYSSGPTCASRLGLHMARGESLRASVCGPIYRPVSHSGNQACTCAVEDSAWSISSPIHGSIDAVVSPIFCCKLLASRARIQHEYVQCVWLRPHDAYPASRRDHLQQHRR